MLAERFTFRKRQGADFLPRKVTDAMVDSQKISSKLSGVQKNIYRPQFAVPKIW